MNLVNKKIRIKVVAVLAELGALCFSNGVSALKLRHSCEVGDIKMRQRFFLILLICSLGPFANAVTTPQAYCDSIVATSQNLKRCEVLDINPVPFSGTLVQVTAMYLVKYCKNGQLSFIRAIQEFSGTAGGNLRWQFPVGQSAMGYVADTTTLTNKMICDLPF